MQFTLNGKRVRVDAPPLTRLLDVLRESCGLTGTKEGCGEGECGGGDHEELGGAEHASHVAQSVNEWADFSGRAFALTSVGSCRPKTAS